DADAGRAAPPPGADQGEGAPADLQGGDQREREDHGPLVAVSADAGGVDGTAPHRGDGGDPERTRDAAGAGVGISGGAGVGRWWGVARRRRRLVGVHLALPRGRRRRHERKTYSGKLAT